ncbi:MAG: hypothetical protein A2846_04935 [Candidatus Doudnabacteria bacterium RIFCSPHIGHO2_01_FULL_49_9]|uniref:Uncharacterized protein n=1 Tax=Candidatus Doudnabacteria bacterium RIFCSPHIGHO2_01_FULL_49_9 TaxID=1817827 RepID=A0A1F5P0A6_9BACT|nr:MAG: hypothetical protein A2846_04935 [Candidatus Doudnabacteria bacterium RIFCSPHIGHO2_01_FULL_49_9]
MNSWWSTDFSIEKFVDIVGSSQSCGKQINLDLGGGLLARLGRDIIKPMKAAKGKLTICSRGHRFFKSATRPVCPICWPGRYKKRNRTNFSRS